MIRGMNNTIRVACLALASCVVCAPAASAQATLEISDYLVMPMTGSVDGKA